jgi:hypothetical protein
VYYLVRVYYVRVVDMLKLVEVLIMSDLIEFEEQNFEDLVEDFFRNKDNKMEFERWLWDEGYTEFLTSDKMCAKWSEFVEEGMRERQNGFE